MPEPAASDISTTPDSEADHPLTVAARNGIGPLSARSREVWHGQSAPCASCAQLNDREAQRCAHCGQDLSAPMLEKMAKHSGPWFVYDNVRPFPGVSLERIVSLIRRGALQPTSIVRGPTTRYQWRYAIEAPIISRHLGRCWRCQATVILDDSACPECNVVLQGSYKQDQLQPPGEPPAPAEMEDLPASGELAALSEAIEQAGGAREYVHSSGSTEAPLGRAALIFLAITVIVVGLIVAWTSLGAPESNPAAPSDTPAIESNQ
ncbi:MAG: zinc ribbon domain-containing protein [Planctomycetes bacterium]|nr:zinc ribbon domain-containing protein [Planctomycetota bacterium]